MKKQAVILITSPQGGSGKSTIAVNLAIHYAKQNIKVLLIDMAGYGSLPSMLKIPVRGVGMSSLITAMEQTDNLQMDESILQYFKDSLVIYNDIRNLHLLLSASPLKMEKLTKKQTDFILQVARKENYQMVIIDTSSELCQRNISCIENSDYILIPTLQDVTSGWKIILFKEIMDSLNISKDKVALVVNRSSKYSGFNNKELETEIGYSVLAEIPELAKVIQKHVNTGVPIEASGRKKAQKPIHELARQVLRKVGG